MKKKRKDWRKIKLKGRNKERSRPIDERHTKRNINEERR
jgi:hypothetical protein